MADLSPALVSEICGILDQRLGGSDYVVLYFPSEDTVGQFGTLSPSETAKVFQWLHENPDVTEVDSFMSKVPADGR